VISRRLVSAFTAVALGLCLAGCNTQLLTRANILDLDSNSNVDPSGNFTAPGSWELHVTYDCSKQKSQGVADLNRFDMIVYNSDDASSNFEHPEVHLTGPKHTQLLKFKRGGTFYIDIDSRCDWRLSVVDTSGVH